MAIRFKDAYAGVFEVEVFDKYVKARLSTGRKDIKTDKFINSSWGAKFFGKCVDQAKELEDKDRIKIISGIVANEPYVNRDGETKSFLSVTIWEFEKLEHTEKSTSKDKPAPKKGKVTDNEDIDDDPTPL